MITYNEKTFLLTKRQCCVRGKDLLHTTEFTYSLENLNLISSVK